MELEIVNELGSEIRKERDELYIDRSELIESIDMLIRDKLNAQKKASFYKRRYKVYVDSNSENMLKSTCQELREEISFLQNHIN